MRTRFHRQCLDILHADGPARFRQVCVEVGQSLGFKTIGCAVITEHAPDLIEFQTITNAPKEWMGDFENLEVAKLDPVVQHCKRSCAPIIWERGTYEGDGKLELWDHQAAYGFRSGIAIALHLPRARHFLIGFDSEDLRCATPKSKLGMSLDFEAFASFAQAAAFDICIPYKGSGDSAVAEAELEALRRSIDGATDETVSNLLGISQTELSLRLRRAATKLGCGTRYEAALRAIKLGLIRI